MNPPPPCASVFLTGPFLHLPTDRSAGALTRRRLRSTRSLRLGSAWANRLPGGAMGRLQDKIAVVTGAGAGIGKASAIRFAEEGATVLVTSRSETNAAETAHRSEEHTSELQSLM